MSIYVSTLPVQAQHFHNDNLRYDGNNYQEIVLHTTGSEFCICTRQEVNSAFARAVHIKVDWGKGKRNVVRAEDLREKGSRPKGARDHVQQSNHVQLKVRDWEEDFMIDIVGAIKLHFTVPQTSHIRMYLRRACLLLSAKCSYVVSALPYINYCTGTSLQQHLYNHE